MKTYPKIEVVDITDKKEYEKYLYKCLAPMPFRRYSRRQEYLENAIPKGFHKKLLILDGDVVGQIEYTPSEASGYPISGKGIIVMSCIWVLRRAKGHNFGKLLIEDMIKNERNASGFATIALENHPSPWFKKWQMEKLGFEAVDMIRVVSKRKQKEKDFAVYLMWMTANKNAKPPKWNKQELLKGVTFCTAHPLYCPQTWKGNMLEAKKQRNAVLEPLRF